MKRTFLENYLFPPGDREISWAVLAGGLWLVVGVGSLLLGLGLVLTVWFAGGGIAAIAVGCCLPIWLARQILIRRSAAWAAGAAVYAVVLGVIFTFNILATGDMLSVGAGLIVLAILSSLAAWELHRRPIAVAL